LSEILVFHVRPIALADFIRHKMPSGPFCVPLRELDVLRLRTVFDWLFPHLVQPDEGSALLMRAGIPLLWDIVLQTAKPWQPDGLSTRRGSSIINSATQLFRKDILKHPTVEDIARGVGLSASQLRRIFSAGGALSPDKVFRGVRMDYARRLLVGSRMPVARISEELGFNSPSAFTRAFKAYYNQTPQALRSQ
jgi:AraC-like DNA-binding protein